MLMIRSYTRPFDLVLMRISSQFQCVSKRRSLVPGKLATSQPTKTEAVLFGTRVQCNKIPTASGIDVAGTVVLFHDTVKLLGVTLDSALTMDRHMTVVKLSCNYHIRALWHIRPLLSMSPTRLDIVLWHRGWTTPTHYCTARRSATLTGSR